jgi:hypothetical protein
MTRKTDTLPGADTETGRKLISRSQAFAHLVAAQDARPRPRDT